VTTVAGTAGTTADKPDPLLLDEMFSPAIAAGLLGRGIDCLAVAADPLLRAQSDLEIFEVALLAGRVIVTNNVPDFESLRRAREAVGGEIPGLIYTSDLTFPRTRAYLSRLVTALESAAASHEASRRGGVLWLRPVTRPISAGN
jgi:predicted nuclease of predicted toxin-antitoxin system